MSKIVYLFGAGASYGSLPLVKEMPEWIDKLIETISTEEMSLSDKVDFENPQAIQNNTKRGYQKELIKGLKWLKESSSKHISIDTYAKKLFIKKDISNLKRLKILLSVYFVIEQIRHRPNPRYDFFFASIMNSIHKFPDDIRILSWNYDSQFEIAYSEFSDDNDISNNQSNLNIHIKNKLIERDELKRFGIFKLNGSTELHSGAGYDSKSYFYNLNVTPSLSVAQLETIVKMYAIATRIQDLVPDFSFAWEPSNFENYMDKVKEETKDAEVLVVIGYSFPYFNRSVDREIISNMRGLRRVHFQSPEAKRLIERFKSIRDDFSPGQLIPEHDNRYFFIPDELS